MNDLQEVKDISLDSLIKSALDSHSIIKIEQILGDMDDGEIEVSLDAAKALADRSLGLIDFFAQLHTKLEFAEGFLRDRVIILEKEARKAKANAKRIKNMFIYASQRLDRKEFYGKNYTVGRTDRTTKHFVGEVPEEIFIEYPDLVDVSLSWCLDKPTFSDYQALCEAGLGHLVSIRKYWLEPAAKAAAKAGNEEIAKHQIEKTTNSIKFKTQTYIPQIAYEAQ